MAISVNGAFGPSDKKSVTLGGKLKAGSGKFDFSTEVKRLSHTDGSKASKEMAKGKEVDDNDWEVGGKHTVSYIGGKRIITRNDGSVAQLEEVTSKYKNGKTKTSKVTYDDGESYETHYNRNGNATQTVHRDNENRVKGYVIYKNPNAKEGPIHFLDANKNLTYEWQVSNDGITIINHKSGEARTISFNKDQARKG